MSNLLEQLLTIVYEEDIKGSIELTESFETKEIVRLEENPLKGLNKDSQKMALSNLPLKEIATFSNFLSKQDFEDICRAKYGKCAEGSLKERLFGRLQLEADEKARDKFVHKMIYWEYKHGNLLLASTTALQICFPILFNITSFLMFTFFYVYLMYRLLPSYLFYAMTVYVASWNIALVFNPKILVSILDSDSILLRLLLCIGMANISFAGIFVSRPIVIKAINKSVISLSNIINKIPIEYLQPTIYFKMTQNFYKTD